MTSLIQHLLLTPALGLLQPGYLAWVQAAGTQRGAVPRSKQTLCATPAVQSPQPGAAALHAHSDESSSEIRPVRRLGSETRYVRRWLQPRLHDLYEALYRSALSGDMEATRLLLRMGGLDGKAETPKKKPTKVGAGFAKKAMEQFRAR